MALQGSQQQEAPSEQTEAVVKHGMTHVANPCAAIDTGEAASAPVSDNLSGKTVHDAASLLNDVAISIVHDHLSGSTAHDAAADTETSEATVLSEPLPTATDISDADVRLPVNGTAAPPVVRCAGGIETCRSEKRRQLAA